MTRTELDTLRAEYLTQVPADFIRGAFFSKAQLEALLSKHADCSGLFFYIIPNTSGASKFTMYSEPFNPMKQRYPELPSESSDVNTRGLDEDGACFDPCPPDTYCPPPER